MCLSPIYIRDRMQFVPCGKCSECIKSLSQIWIYRNKYELSKSDLGLFVTLTYEDSHLPFVEVVDPVTGEYDITPGFNKDHLQRYFKRVRKELDLKGIRMRYMVVSEYGDKFDRPHYHGLFYFRNLPDEYNIISRVEDILLKHWYYGQLFFGDIEDSSIAYVCKYVLKDKEPPPNSMKPIILYSRNPGIGMDYIEDNKDWHHGEYERQFFKPLQGDVKIPLNYYIKSKLYNLKEGSYDRIMIDIMKRKHDMSKCEKMFVYDYAYDNLYESSYSCIADNIKRFKNDEFFEKLRYKKQK